MRESKSNFAQIRQADANDLGHIINFLQILWPDFELNHELVEKIFLDDLKSGKVTYLLAEVSKLSVGLAILVTREDFRFRKIAIIDVLVVTDDYRGQGIGSELMSKMEEISKIQGCKRIELHSNKHRIDAHRFYENLGFEKTSYYFKKVL
jgi:GNAT superfamily N-acetyltransferase